MSSHILISKTKDIFIIPYTSQKLSIQNDHIELNYSNYSIKQMLEICTSSHLTKETYELIDHLGLNYLLFNHNVNIKSRIASQIKLKRIMELNKIDILNILFKLNELIIYFCEDIKYVDINFNDYKYKHKINKWTGNPYIFQQKTPIIFNSIYLCYL